MIPLIGAAVEAISSLLGMGKTVVEQWQTRQTMRAENDMKIEQAKVDAQIRYIETDQKAEIDWDMLAVGQLDKSWKDEWFTSILSIPLVGCFIPGLSDYILQGFAVLDRTPDWYKWSIAIAISAAFGYRKLADSIGKLLNRGAK